MNEPYISIKTIFIGAIVCIVALVILAFWGKSIVDSQTPIYQSDTATSTQILLKTTPVSTSSISTSPIKKIIATSSIGQIPLSIIVTPSSGIIEGDPVMISVHGGTTSSNQVANIKTATLVAMGPNMTGASSTATLHFLTYKNIPTAFYGTGISQKTGTTTVTVTMKNGTKLTAIFWIGARVSPTESLPVPAQLGGNSTSSQQQLLTNLSAENAILADVYSNPSSSFWAAPFAWPLHPTTGSAVSTSSASGIIVTDPFGYNRDSGAETIIHKGTDFKATPGTPVYAINAGYVRVTKLFTVYGNTVIVDHGMGIQSFYMHLTKWVVTPGQAVKQGQLLGYSGETGYSEGPHLHLTIRVGGVSIDPMKFYELFGLKP